MGLKGQTQRLVREPMKNLCPPYLKFYQAVSQSVCSTFSQALAMGQALSALCFLRMRCVNPALWFMPLLMIHRFLQRLRASWYIVNVSSLVVPLTNHFHLSQQSQATERFVDWLTTIAVKKEVADGAGGGAGKAKIVLCGHRSASTHYALSPFFTVLIVCTAWVVSSSPMHS